MYQHRFPLCWAQPLEPGDYPPVSSNTSMNGKSPVHGRFIAGKNIYKCRISPQFHVWLPERTLNMVWKSWNTMDTSNFMVYSPIFHGHVMANRSDTPTWQEPIDFHRASASPAAMDFRLKGPKGQATLRGVAADRPLNAFLQDWTTADDCGRS